MTERRRGSAFIFRNFASCCAAYVIFHFSQGVVPFAHARAQRSWGVSITPQGSCLFEVGMTDGGFLSLQAVERGEEKRPRCSLAIRFCAVPWKDVAIMLSFYSLPSPAFFVGSCLPLLLLRPASPGTRRVLRRLCGQFVYSRPLSVELLLGMDGGSRGA